MAQQPRYLTNAVILYVTFRPFWPMAFPFSLITVDLVDDSNGGCSGLRGNS